MVHNCKKKHASGIIKRRASTCLILWLFTTAALADTAFTKKQLLASFNEQELELNTQLSDIPATAHSNNIASDVRNNRQEPTAFIEPQPSRTDKSNYWQTIWNNSFANTALSTNTRQHYQPLHGLQTIHCSMIAKLQFIGHCSKHESTALNHRTYKAYDALEKNASSEKTTQRSGFLARLTSIKHTFEKYQLNFKFNTPPANKPTINAGAMPALLDNTHITSVTFHSIPDYPADYFDTQNTLVTKNSNKDYRLSVSPTFYAVTREIHEPKETGFGAELNLKIR